MCRERTKDEDQIRRTVEVWKHVALLLHTLHMQVCTIEFGTITNFYSVFLNMCSNSKA